MKTEYWQKGSALDYKNNTNTTIQAGTLVKIQDRFGIAGDDIEPGQTGSLVVEGCFKMPKASGEAYDVGTNLFTDEENDCITKVSGSGDAKNIAVGYAANSAKATDTYAIVKLIG
ncbi:MAG: DUF2190 family protein [Eubacterium sp.]|jgi:predicted RecA/RadA family phage recombinase|nr:DUF2190 family protein [Eubacterium sp.]